RHTRNARAARSLVLPVVRGAVAAKYLVALQHHRPGRVLPIVPHGLRDAGTWRVADAIRQWRDPTAEAAAALLADALLVPAVRRQPVCGAHLDGSGWRLDGTVHGQAGAIVPTHALSKLQLPWRSLAGWPTG